MASLRMKKRIYDPLKGKTCHQCKKTLGLCTHCSECSMVQGQFCGDCLFLRYGEHVFEALENLNWICPVCRGICNCSLCWNRRMGSNWSDLPKGTLFFRSYMTDLIVLGWLNITYDTHCFEFGSCISFERLQRQSV